MKKVIIYLSISLFAFSAIAQEISNIRVSRRNDLIEINYDLLYINSTSKFKVSIYCSINSEERFMINSVFGDIGLNIQSGNNKRVIWEIKNDLSLNKIQRIENMEFFIQIEKQKIDLSLKSDKIHYLIGYTGSIVDPIGARLGFVKNWGGYISGRFSLSYSVSGGLIKQILKSPLFIYSGLGIGNWGWLYGDFDYWDNRSAFEYTLGLMVFYRSFYFEVGGTSLYSSSRGVIPDFTFGAGLNF